MPAFTVTFQFSPCQRVVTPWGDMGVITDAAVNEDGGHLYFVERDRESKWIRGELLQNAGELVQGPIPDTIPDPLEGPFEFDFSTSAGQAERPADVAGGYQPEVKAGAEGEPPAEE